VRGDHLLRAHTGMMPLVPVHPFAARGFRDAEAYERGRPGYPPEALAWLAERLRLGPGATVADVGAGTGKLTRQLLATGARVLAVEPMKEMRRVLSEAVPDAEVLAGAAESIPLADASVDAVTAGQAAHWFSPDEAAAEIARVLRPGGGVAFIWNGRDLADPLQAAIDALIAPSRGRAPVEKWGRWRDAFERGAFTPFELREFRHVHELALADLAALVSSYSYVGALPPAEREALLERVRNLARSSNKLSLGPAGPRVRLTYRTDAYASRRDDDTRRRSR
jgi:SAM-dependent methyltransferase